MKIKTTNVSTVLALILAIVIILLTCNIIPGVFIHASEEPAPVVTPEPTPEPIPEPEPDPMDIPLGNYEKVVPYLAKTVWGEARGSSTTKQAAVIWCILNRVDNCDTQTPEDIIRVITAPNQFHGYKEYHPTERHSWLAEDVLKRWLREKAGETDVGRILPENYLYFGSSPGSGGNRFRTSYKSTGVYWDWSLESPYEE